MKLLTRAEVESGWLPDDVEGIEYGRRADATILRAVELLRAVAKEHIDYTEPLMRGGSCRCSVCQFLRDFDGEEQPK